MNSILNNVFKKGNFNKNKNQKQNLNNINNINLENENQIQIDENEEIMNEEFNFENYNNDNNNNNNEDYEGNNFNTGYISSNKNDKVTKGKKKDNNNLRDNNEKNKNEDEKEIKDDESINKENNKKENEIKVIEDNNKNIENKEEINENKKENEDINMSINEINENNIENEELNNNKNKEDNYTIPEKINEIPDSKYIINTTENIKKNDYEEENLMEIDNLENKNETLSKNYFNEYINSTNNNNSNELIKQFYSSIIQLSQNQIIKLTSLLKTILTPNIQSKLTGNYKTGKRLNMKKIISFIASNYRQDKIWLRRTLPFNRDYYITISIDNSLSMKSNNIGYYAIQTLIILVNSLQKVGIDNLNINLINDDCIILYDYNKEKSLLNSEKLIDIIKHFKFNFASNNSLDFSMRNFLIKNIKNIENSTVNSNKLKYNINFIISDGRMNKDNVKGLTALAKEKGILYVFIIIDKYKFEDNNSIIKSQSVSFDENGNLKVKNYLEDFPFQYYVIVQDIEDLPYVVKGILVKWIENIN